MFNSFYLRILLLVVGLVVVAQLTTFLALLSTLDKDIKAETRQQLNAGSTLLTQLVDKRSQLLLNSAQVLAADYGFKSAIASRDQGTINSALSNNVVRVDADLASLISLDGRLISTTHSVNEDAEKYARVASKAGVSGHFMETLVLADKARQVVVVPVKAPLTIGWLLLGFSLNDSLANDLASQIGMQVSFSGQLGDRQHYFGSTLPPEQRAALPRAINELTHSTAGQIALLQNEAFLTQLVVLDRLNGGVSAILQKSLDSALQSYQRLRNRLILLTSLSLALAIALAFWMAHSVTRPLQMLSAAAARIKDGHYGTRLDLQRCDEFGQLADTFNRMQTGISEREEHIAHLAFHDELTQLPNLRLARDRLKQQISIADRQDESVAIIVLGVDRYKQVTETLGHLIGERLIKELARRVSRQLREGDTVARVSNDEFLIISGNADEMTVRALTRDIVLQMSQPILLDDAELTPRISAGVSLYPEHGTDETELIRRADIALTDARESMREIEFYQHGRDENHLRQLSIVADLKRAVDENQFVMHYQPKICMASGTVSSVEALVRWIHPIHGFMPPDEFIGLAEKSGNISMLSNWILQAVISQIALWRAAGVTVKSAVNLSAMDLQDDGLPNRIEGYLAKYGLVSTDLIIEVTESAMMRDADKALTILHRLRDSGFSVSIDDFGTGYSSLAKLRELPIDELKIDRSFIIDIKPDTTEALIVKAIIDLGHSMNMSITTEGIETREEWDLLNELGSNTIQGYYISRPLLADDFTAWWLEHQINGKNLAA
ncbi:putative bifunctional diguanylate cyclase/phosphodiesterase [Granulosicoccus antarcticus]|uniref:Putative signaling protein n=1 Tax=Granulosicoccus antarcticus IMCC3135 TaxID=1192854 RepID=A0A2Z2NJH2_9GAMM|nr:EAL domain-containing protein [Granulosicoccus antarcticus]ASJ71456.1 putative signaling protein [Granulosicoccus antarcticus IMCC3135]